ncbi:RDD family protein [Cellulomonas sp.]|uniref:RDD family protein n=1 Tax=Cellulomonas sp. TaxID=40001 RepID=UPI003BABCFFE
MTDDSPYPVVGPDLSWGPPPVPAAAPEPPLYAPWWQRALGAVVDVLVTFAVYLLGVALTLLTDPDGTAEPPTVGGVVVVAGAVLIPVVWIWNRGRQQGRSGQSLGRSLTGTRLVSATTGQPIGSGPALSRDLLHVLDLPLLVGFLWPLGDRRRQTFADKAAGTVVVRHA